MSTLVVLVEPGSFTRAVEKLQISQAAVGRHPRQPEERLGLLVIRRTRGIAGWRRHV